jgi:hypothetical protein
MLIDYFRYVISDLLLKSQHVCFLSQLIHFSFFGTEDWRICSFHYYVFNFSCLFKCFRVFRSPGTVLLDSTGCTSILEWCYLMLSNKHYVAFYLLYSFPPHCRSSGSSTEGIILSVSYCKEGRNVYRFGFTCSPRFVEFQIIQTTN